MDNEAVRRKVIKILVQREIRLKRVEDFAIILNGMGGIMVFLDFE